jgi:hypothetical protein
MKMWRLFVKGLPGEFEVAIDVEFPAWLPSGATTPVV